MKTRSFALLALLNFFMLMPGIFAATGNTTAAPAPATASADAIKNDVAQSQKLVTQKTDALKQSLGSDTTLNGLLSQVTTALGSGQDSAALQSLTKLYSAKLTPAQMKLASQLRDETTALVLQRDLAAVNPSLAGPVHDTVAALRTANYTTAIKGLTTLSSQASLTPAQKDLLKNMLGQYAPAAQKAADAASSALGGLNSLGIGK